MQPKMQIIKKIKKKQNYYMKHEKKKPEKLEELNIKILKAKYKKFNYITNNEKGTTDNNNEEEEIEYVEHE